MISRKSNFTPFKKALTFCSILGLFFLFRGFILNNLFFFDIKQEPLFFSEYIFNHIFFSFWVTIGIGLINLFLLYNIGLRVHTQRFGIILAFLYAITPWSAYVDILGGNHVYLLSWILAFTFSVILHKQNYKYSALLLFVTSIGTLTASVFGLLILATLLLGIYIINYLNLRQFKKMIIITIITSLITIIMLLTNIDTTKNLVKTNTQVLLDIGILNTVNQLRGETKFSEFSTIGKIAENKYLYIGEKLLLNLSMNFSPSLFFTPQFKLFNFSFTPPVYLGFIIPFILGVISLRNQKRFLMASVILIIGFSLSSILGKNNPDLARLILISPIIYAYIGLGLIKTKNKSLLLIIFFLIIFQLLVVISDIGLREKTRLDLFYNQFS